MSNAVIIIFALLLAGHLAFSKRLGTSSNWKATVTPLASIMGSGFLVPCSTCCSVWCEGPAPASRTAGKLPFFQVLGDMNDV
jgi:hypothetical protein